MPSRQDRTRMKDLVKVKEELSVAEYNPMGNVFSLLSSEAVVHIPKCDSSGDSDIIPIYSNLCQSDTTRLVFPIKEEVFYPRADKESAGFLLNENTELVVLKIGPSPSKWVTTWSLKTETDICVQMVVRDPTFVGDEGGLRSLTWKGDITITKDSNGPTVSFRAGPTTEAEDSLSSTSSTINLDGVDIPLQAEDDALRRRVAALEGERNREPICFYTESGHSRPQIPGLPRNSMTATYWCSLDQLRFEDADNEGEPWTLIPLGEELECMNDA